MTVSVDWLDHVLEKGVRRIPLLWIGLLQALALSGVWCEGQEALGPYPTRAGQQADQLGA